MRKFNAVLTAVIFVLFLIHGILGAFAITGVGHINFKPVAWIMMGLIAVHTVIGIILTAQSMLVWKKTGAPYFKENALFWARRVSGFAIMLLIFFHITAFSYTTYGVYRLKFFDAFKLTTQILLVLSLAVHIITNVRPTLIAFGVKNLRRYAGDILLFISIILLFMAAAFIIYYLRWNVL